MKAFEELSDNAKEVMAMLGDCGPTTRAKDAEVSGCDADSCSFYLTSENLREYADGLREVAEWLDERATEHAAATAREWEGGK